MDFFDRHKALIITVLLFSVIFLAMYNIRVYNSNNDISEMLVQLREYESEEKLQEKEQEKVENDLKKPSPAVETHQAFNTNKEESEAEFQERLDEIFEKNSAEQEASEKGENSSEGKLAVPTNRENEPKQRSDGNNSSEETSTKQGSMRNSSISFSLVGREAIDIPNPIYTCDTPGRIVVNIKVNSEGMVTETTINEASSSTNNECLTNQALKYASGAIFTELAGRDDQPGTITFNFQD